MLVRKTTSTIALKQLHRVAILPPKCQTYSPCVAADFGRVIWTAVKKKESEIKIGISFGNFTVLFLPADEKIGFAADSAVIPSIIVEHSPISLNWSIELAVVWFSAKVKKRTNQLGVSRR
jgi:hypothetical protein